MSHFLGSHANKVDVKGRVSIPAPFRTALRALAQEDAPQLLLRLSHRETCVEGWPPALFKVFEEPLRQMAMFDEDHDDLAYVLYPQTYAVDSDKEGRIVLPDQLARHAGISDTVVFMGVGDKFEIWEPAAAERRVAEARERARARRLTLPAKQSVLSPAPSPATSPAQVVA